MNNEIQNIKDPRANKGLIEDFQMARELAGKVTDIKKAHIEALHAERVAGRMANKIIRMLQRGEETQDTYIGPLGMPSTKDVDDTTGTLALNARLKQSGIPARAEFYRGFDSEGGKQIHTLLITHVGDEQVNKSYLNRHQPKNK